MKALNICCCLMLTSALRGPTPAVVPPEYPPASHPDFLLNTPTADVLAARYPWIPQPLYYAGADSVGPLDPDFLGPALALVDWNRDGLLDVVVALCSETYSHRPVEQRYRALVYRNSGQRQQGTPVFEEPFQVDLGMPLGPMVFDDADGDGVMDLVVYSKGVYRWYRDSSTSGERRFEFRGNLGDYGRRADLRAPENVGGVSSLQWVDWDGDGSKDLIVAGSGGNTFYYPRPEVGFGKGFALDGSWVGGDRFGAVGWHKNLGRREGRLWFSSGQRFVAGEDERAISFFDSASVVVTDWDEDGRSDLVVTSHDALFLYRNVGAPRAPRLDAGRRILVAGGARLPFQRQKVLEANWNASDRHNLILRGSSFSWYLRNTGKKGAPDFEAIGTLLQKHSPVSAGDFAVVATGDLNADGHPDLVFGNEDGFLLYVENSSAGADPVSFRPAVRLDAGGSVFRVESARGVQGPAEARWGYTMPVLTDWDGDGDLDVIVGSIESHYVYLENKGTRGKPQFAVPQVFREGGRTLGVPWRTRPAVHDFDGDGRKDLLTLDPEGMLTLYRSTGTLEFQAAERILDERGAPIKLDGKERETGRAMLTLMDWDDDGKLDLIVGNAIENFDGLRWYRNVGSERKWVMARQPNIPLNLPWNHYHQLEPVDWNGDGKLDLLAGSEGGWVYYYRRK